MNTKLTLATILGTIAVAGAAMAQPRVTYVSAETVTSLAHQSPRVAAPKAPTACVAPFLPAVAMPGAYDKYCGCADSPVRYDGTIVTVCRGSVVAVRKAAR